MLATPLTLPTAVNSALDAVHEARTQAALLSTELLAEVIREYMPDATTLTVDATTGAPVGISATGLTIWATGEYSLLPDTPLVRIQRTVRDLFALYSDPTALTDIGWLTTTDGRFVIVLP